MIYLDNAATTQVHPDVLSAMLPYLQEQYGNPSSIHQLGRSARQAVEEARKQVGKYLDVNPSEVIFTSGGTEANHSALFGAFLASRDKRHLITSAIEHHAILDTAHFLEGLGASVTYIQPNENGVVGVADVLSAIRDDTFCITLMSVNNELGSVQPIFELAERVKEIRPDIVIHSDMIQAAGGIQFNLSSTEIDLASISAHKIHGPKGVGALYIRKGTPWLPVVHGGSQERERRAGTENVASIVGFGQAALRIRRNWEEHLRHLANVKSLFLRELSSMNGFDVNSPDDGAPSIVNVGFHGVRRETLLMRLDLEGILASAGSACTAGTLEPSHVLQACGLDAFRVESAIRFSFSDFTSEEEVVRAAHIVKECVAAIRNRT